MSSFARFFAIFFIFLSILRSARTALDVDLNLPIVPARLGGDDDELAFVI